MKPGLDLELQGISFANGVSWTRADIITKELTSGSSGNNAIYGTPGADTIDRRRRSMIMSYGGGDTFDFNSGYGNL